MELLGLIGVLVALELVTSRLAPTAGTHLATEHQQRAIDAVRGGDSALYFSEMRAADEAFARASITWEARAKGPATEAELVHIGRIEKAADRAA